MARTDETIRSVVNRLLRRRARRGADPPAQAPPLPKFSGRPLLDPTDTSAVLAVLEDERLAQRGLP
jgi:hypothetical protein